MPRSTHKRRQLKFFALCLGVILFINLFANLEYHSFSLVVNLGLRFGFPGSTQIVIPPVGTLRANTHWLPLRLRLELKQVNLSLLRNVVFANPQSLASLYTELNQGFRGLIILFIVKLIGLALLGAIFSLFFFGIRDNKVLFFGGLAGIILISIFIAGLYLSYDLNGFQDLEYEGIIEAAPWLLNLAWQTLDQVESLGERVQVLAKNLYSALEKLEQLGPVGLLEADIIALHVSDIHNNPVAYDFAHQVIESFPVDFVMDTGDLTDWGTTLEAEISSRIKELDLPYLFVTGNHESPEVLARLGEIDNVIIVDHHETNLLGLRIAGAGDLAATKMLPAPAPVADLTRQSQLINEYWLKVDDRPQIFMVHNHRVAKAIEPGLFPLVLYGHTHVLEIQQLENSVYVNAGTTGAAGIRGFQNKEPLPYSLSLLYFTYNEEGIPILKAVDGVHVAGLGQSFSLQRTFIEHGRKRDPNVEMVR